MTGRDVYVFSGVFLGVIAIACSAPDMREFTTTKPLVEDVAGTWRLRPSDVPALQKRRAIDASQSVLELRTSGSFTWTNAPGFLVDRSGSPDPAELVTWSGAWRISEGPQCSLSLHTTDAAQSTRSWAYFFSATKPYTLGFERSEGETYGFTRDEDTARESEEAAPK